MLAPQLTALEVLDAIDAWALKASRQEVTDLVTVLSAIRGPDETHKTGINTIKYRTTAMIRSAVLPRACDVAGLAINMHGLEDRRGELPMTLPKSTSIRINARQRIKEAYVKEGIERVAKQLALTGPSDGLASEDEALRCFDGASEHFKEHLARALQVIGRGVNSDGSSRPGRSDHVPV